MDNLQNSMAQEPNSSNLVVEHAKAMQSIVNCQTIIKRALADYAIRNDDKGVNSNSKHNDLLWILMPALTNIKNILDSVIEP